MSVEEPDLPIIELRNSTKLIGATDYSTKKRFQVMMATDYWTKEILPKLPIIELRTTDYWIKSYRLLN